MYLADPHSPWQLPTDENGNGLIRRSVGKAPDLTTFTPADVSLIGRRSDTVSRRVLDWATADTSAVEAVAMTG